MHDSAFDAFMVPDPAVISVKHKWKEFHDGRTDARMSIESGAGAAGAAGAGAPVHSASVSTATALVPTVNDDRSVVLDDDDPIPMFQDPFLECLVLVSPEAVNRHGVWVEVLSVDKFLEAAWTGQHPGTKLSVVQIMQQIQQDIGRWPIFVAGSRVRSVSGLFKRLTVMFGEQYDARWAALAMQGCHAISFKRTIESLGMESWVFDSRTKEQSWTRFDQNPTSKGLVWMSRITFVCIDGPRTGERAVCFVRLDTDEGFGTLTLVPD